MWIETPDPSPSETPEVVYLLSDNPVIQNLLTVFGFITALAGAVGVIYVAIRFVVRPIRELWRNRVQLHAEVTSPARYGNIVSPRGMTFPRVVVTITNLSLVRTLPKARVQVSTLPAVEPSDQGDFKPERTLEVQPPLTEAHLRGRNASEVIAPDNWEYADEIAVTLTWETKRISATKSKRKGKTWKFMVADIKGVRPI